MKWMIFLLTVLTSIGIAQSPSPSPSPGPKKIRVLEIDTGVDSANLEIVPYLNKDHMTKNPADYLDYHGHGTHIAGLITNKTCSAVELYSCKYFDPHEKGNGNLKREVNCLNIAATMGLDMVVYAGGGTDPNDDEKAALEKLDAAGVAIIVAAGNEHSDMAKEPYYPASYGLKNMIVVGNLQQDPDTKVTKRARSSNYNFKRIAFKIGTGVESTLPGNRTGPMTGTSQATAVMANQMLRFRCEERK